MIGFQIEKAGIPVVQITAVPSASVMVGVSRILSGKTITNPYGDAELPPDRERELRRKYITRALELLHTDVDKSTLFTLDGVAP